MAKTIYYVASSLDGYIATEDDDIGWLTDVGFEAFQEHYDAFMSGIGAMIMGSRTYEYLLGQGKEAWSYGSMPAWVFTTRAHERIDGAVIEFASGDIAAILPDVLAAADGKHVWVVGGGDVAAQCFDAGMLDELWLTVMPIVLGRGRPVLPAARLSSRLELVTTTPFDGSAIELRYRLR